MTFQGNSSYESQGTEQEVRLFSKFSAFEYEPFVVILRWLVEHALKFRSVNINENPSSGCRGIEERCFVLQVNCP